MTNDLNWMQTHCPAALLPGEMSYRKLRSHPSIEERDSWLQLPFEFVCILKHCIVDWILVQGKQDSVIVDCAVCVCVFGLCECADLLRKQHTLQM